VELASTPFFFYPSGKRVKKKGVEANSTVVLAEDGS